MQQHKTDWSMLCEQDETAWLEGHNCLSTAGTGGIAR